ncbi:hypothetical protein ACJJTC_009791 [Scirpophaga incertulas]
MERINNSSTNNNDSDSDKLLNSATSEDENKDSNLNSSDRPSSARSSGSSDSGSVVIRSRFSDLLNINTLVNRVKRRKSKSPVLVTSASTKNNEKALVPVTNEKSSTQVMTASHHTMFQSLLCCLTCNGALKNLLSSSKPCTTQVTIVLVGAKALPPPVEDGASHRVYCKFRLGSEEYNSKSVNHCAQPEWKQRFYLRLYEDNLLELSLWDKGKQKNFMGSTVLDLSKFEKERTHEINQRLNAGYGDIGPHIHFSVTICVIRDIPSSLDMPTEEAVCANKEISNLNSDWKLVGQLHVKVLGAKGLSSKPSAYCTLELDNEWVQTFDAKSSSEPVWNKSYVFNVYDVTSTLDVKVYDSSFKNALRFESLGRVSIPLLRINNGETRWFGLKNKGNRNSARGNCPRIQLEMTMFWNPIKATVRLFQPKEVKYLKKPPKFDVALVYSNLEFMRDTFRALYDINEFIKRSFEWESKELSFTVLVGWLVFWFYVKMWAIPLVLLLPFFYFWVTNYNQLDKSPMKNYRNATNIDQTENDKNDTGMMKRIQGLQDLTLTITKGVEYLVSVTERIFNLVSFKVPFLSFLAMMFLVISAFSFYFIPFNYTMMALGLYKFTRKYLNPDRTLNNDLLDFLSRVPDSEIWKDWNELNVPEPSIKRNSSTNKSASECAGKSSSINYDHTPNC